MPIKGADLEAGASWSCGESARSPRALILRASLQFDESMPLRDEPMLTRHETPLVGPLPEALNFIRP